MVKAGKLFILSAPSGAGKTTLTHAVVNRLREECDLRRVITYTSKKARVGELDGVDYHFLTEAEFLKRMEHNYFVEHSTVYGAYYGFPRYVFTQVDAGANYIAILDHQGAMAIRGHRDDAVLIWINPPSRESLEVRLRGRGQDDAQTIATRLAIAQTELDNAHKETFYHHVIVNDEFAVAQLELETIIRETLSSI